jgi:hypothetical protein
VDHWRAALKDWHNEGAIPQQRQIKQMIAIANALRLSDDVVLLPDLVSLATAENVVAIKPRRSPAVECQATHPRGAADRG